MIRYKNSIYSKMMLCLLLVVFIAKARADESHRLFNFAKYAQMSSEGWRVWGWEERNFDQFAYHHVNEDCSQSIGTFPIVMTLVNDNMKTSHGHDVLRQKYYLILSGLPSYSSLMNEDKDRLYKTGSSSDKNPSRRNIQRGNQDETQGLRWMIETLVCSVQDKPNLYASKIPIGNNDDAIDTLIADAKKWNWNYKDQVVERVPMGDKTFVKLTVKGYPEKDYWDSSDDDMDEPDYIKKHLFLFFHPKDFAGKYFGVELIIEGSVTDSYGHPMKATDMVKEPELMEEFLKKFEEVSTVLENELKNVSYTMVCDDVECFVDGFLNDSDFVNTIHHTEDNAAKEDSGSGKYVIPIVIGGVLIGSEEWLRRKLMKKKKRGEKKEEREEKEDDDDEDDEPDQLEMQLFKDFGDTLIQGGDSEYVYACIIRHPKEGGEYVDEELTSRIQVSAGDNYMAVEEQGIVNGWKQAIIQAPESQEPPEEGIVRFRLASGEASYTNKIHFNIVKSGILFAQENLTLPARHKKEVRLPFVAVGMNDGTANVKITITEENGGAETKDYSVQAEWNATNKVYEAVIKDLCLNEKDDEGVPGNFIPYKINIEATNDKKRTVKGELPLNRYYMGLVMQMKSEVNCFLEEHDPMRHELVQVPEIRDGKEYVPAENQCALKLYDWNEEKHALYIIDPEPVDLKFTLKELDDVGGIQNAYQDIFINKTYVQGGIDMVLPGMIDMGGVAGVGQIVTEAHDDVLDDVFNAQQAELQKRVEQQKMIEGLGLSLQARWNSAGEGHLYYILSCRKGVLKAPNRFNAMLEVTALHNGQTYTYKRVVKLMSQPRRSESNEDHSNALKRDDQIREELWKIENAIKYAGLSIRLAPLVAFIDLQLDYYDTDFGYDEDNFKAICKTYTAVMDRESQEAHEATKEPEGLFNITMDWVMRIDRNLNDMQKAMHEIVLVENLPIVGGKLHLDVVWRVSLGIATVGASDMAIMAIQIPAEMKKYVDRGGNSPVRAFFVGAQIATEAYIMEALAAAKMLRAKTILKGAKTGVQGLWKMGRGVSREGMKQLGKETVDVMSKEVVTGLKGWALAQTSWYKGILETSAGKYAKSAMERLKGNPATRLSRAERIAQRQAMRNIENLQTITEMCAANPTTANLQLKAKIMLECQADKNTMILMKNPKLFADNKLMKGVDFQVTRAKFNSALRSIYDEVDQNMLRELSEASGVPIERIKIMRTSSSNATDLLLGKNATFDRDVTYYYIENGKVKYFDQAITEQLYANNFRNAILKRTTGSAPAKIDLSHLTGEELARWKDLEAQRGYDILKYYDQTPLEDIFGHPESYGVDVQRLVDPTLHAEDLVNPHKVAETMMEKGQSRFKEAKALWAKADSMPEGLARDKMYCRAIGEMKEGCRQQVKVFDILCSRDRVRNPMTVVPQDLRKAMELMRTMQDDPTATLSKVEEGLEELNFTMESIPKSNYQLCVDIG